MTHMKRTALFLAAMLLSQAATAGTAFLVREYTTGMTKQCVYDYLGSQVTITIRATQLCPLTIQV